MTLEHIIDAVIAREGGYTNNPSDRGKSTKYGITQVTLADFRQRPVSAEDVHNLTETEARDIYRQVYAIRPGLVKLTNIDVLDLAVDCSVNHGPREAIKMVQYGARIFPDGIFGPETESAANRLNPSVLYQRICAARVRKYGEIITKDHTQAVFASGWLNRAASFIERTF